MSKVANAERLSFSGLPQPPRPVAPTPPRREQLAGDAIDGTLTQVERVGAADSAQDARDDTTAAWA
ncbi:hypothetical protein [Streptomyces europaeiscabiei]|uniref:hypothetical protein n=1 Tax=Streptomyces europaeiscabiei TaxID=146819 RepID=UPI0029BF3B75|nr:hypothetical protein [Streptomyces europaeiscabiei]MDX3613060.1 hypothetical protein [Streptomyces europaeiscabiei]